jgi:hypothetical protein
LVARVWFSIAATFATPNRRQQQSFDNAILAGRRGFIHPAQLQLGDER